MPFFCKIEQKIAALPLPFRPKLSQEYSHQYSIFLCGWHKKTPRQIQFNVLSEQPGHFKCPGCLA